jgi:hypothetical protein|nr:MAG TPA: helix-turn-helix domain protein [Caudoviricetes sp.]
MNRNSKGQFTKVKNIDDLFGKRFGRLTVLDTESYVKNKKRYVECVCECGNRKFYRVDMLKSGNTSSCGCLKKEQDKKNLITKHFTHGMSKTRLYKEYFGIKQRCYDKNHDSYKHYGARGIGMCDEWVNSVESFMKWSLENGYNDSLTIDRIDNNKDYSPENCRWSTPKNQSNNKRNNLIAEVNGEILTIAEIAEKYGFKYETIRRRYNHGNRGEKLIRPLKRVLKR